MLFSLTNLGNYSQVVGLGRDGSLDSVIVYTTETRIFSAVNLPPNCTRPLSGSPYFLPPNATVRESGEISWPSHDWCYLGGTTRGDLSRVAIGTYVMILHYSDITLSPIIVTLLQQPSYSGILLSVQDMVLFLIGASVALISLNIVLALLFRDRFARMRKLNTSHKSERKANKHDGT